MLNYHRLKAWKTREPFFVLYGMVPTRKYDPLKHVEHMIFPWNRDHDCTVTTIWNFVCGKPGDHNDTDWTVYNINLYPIGSMYAIYGNIYHQYTPNVSIYGIHGSYGYILKSQVHGMDPLKSQVTLQINRRIWSSRHVLGIFEKTSTHGTGHTRRMLGMKFRSGAALCRFDLGCCCVRNDETFLLKSCFFSWDMD